MKPSSEALALGKALVDQLRLDDHGDLLARWIANDIALKMDAAQAPGATAQIRQACADAIYALWSHRACLPEGRRPFEALEKVAQLLLDIDPANPRSYYFRAKKEHVVENVQWLDLAANFDQTARVLITYCLQQAAVGQGLAPSEWVNIAEAAGLEAPERLILSFPIGGADYDAPDSKLLRAADRLNGLLADLNRFRKVAGVVAAQLRAQLAALGPVPPRPRARKASPKSSAWEAAVNRRTNPTQRSPV